jgi:hypothetical protein
MTLGVALLIPFAVMLIGLLLWATRPPQTIALPGHDIFALLSQQRHCVRLRFILQALQPEDTEYLKLGGNRALMHALRADRRRIALRYLDMLQAEFKTLIEISRALAVMAPEVVAIEELQRWKLNLVFAMNCAILRWRLRLGLRPAGGFVAISRMATGMARHLEAAISRIAENAMTTPDFPEFPCNGHEGD